MFIVPKTINKERPLESLSRYLDSLDMAASSIATYRRGIKKWILWHRENWNASENPTHEDILEYKKYLMGKYSDTSIEIFLKGVRHFFRWLSVQGIYPDVTIGVKSPVKFIHKFRKETLMPIQIIDLLNSIKTDDIIGMRDFAMINLMLRTALRTCEVSRADISDIVVKNGSPCLMIKGKGRGSKDDFVVLKRDALDPIKKYLEERKPETLDEPLYKSHGLNKKGRMSTASIRRIVKGRLKAIGVNDKRVSTHSLRHTAATIALANGASAVQVKDMLRHAQINTTMMYVHNINRINDAAEGYISFQKS